jgi:hypothetical protein
VARGRGRARGDVEDRADPLDQDPAVAGGEEPLDPEQVARREQLGEPGTEEDFEEDPLFLDADGGDGGFVLVRSIFEEAGGASEGAREIKALDPKERGGIDLAVGDGEDRCTWVESAELALDEGQLVRLDQVSLAQQEQIREGDLGPELAGSPELFQGMKGIDNDRDGAQLELFCEFLVGEESVEDRARVGHAGGLDDEGVVAVTLAGQSPEGEPQVRAGGAADAAVTDLQGGGSGEEVLVDTELSKFVLQDGQPARREGVEQMAEQGGLSGPEEAGKE